MSTSRLPKQKSGDHNDASWHESPEGTSARTRPLSYDDIMRKRKNKEGADKHLGDDPGISDMAEENAFTTPHLIGRDGKNIDENIVKTRSSKARDGESNDDSVPTNSRRTSHDAQAQKFSLRRKRDASPIKNGKSIHGGDKRPGNSEDNPKVTADRNLMADQLSPGKNEKHDYRINKDGGHSNDVDDRSDIRQSRNLLKKDKVSERPRAGSENPIESSRVTADKNVRSDRSSAGKSERPHQRTNKDDLRSNDLDDRSDMRQSRDLVEKDKIPERPRVRSEKPENSSKLISDKNLMSDRSSSSKSEGRHQGTSTDDIHCNDIDDRYDTRQVGDLVEKDKLPERPRVRSEKPENSSKIIADKDVRSYRSSGKRERHHQGRNKDDRHSNDVDDRYDMRQGGDFVEKDKVPEERPRIRSENPDNSSKVIEDKNVKSDRSSLAKSGRHHHGTNKDDIRGNDIDHRSDMRQSRDLVKKDKVPERRRVKSEIVREQLDDEVRHLHRKRKTDDHMSSIPEDRDGTQKRNARDVMRTDKVSDRHKDKSETDKSSDRHKDKSEKESRRKHHDEEDNTRGRSTGKGHDSEKQGLEAKHVHSNQLRSKRKRSRSIEHEKDRGRRSFSHSPKDHKHATKDRRDKGELLSHSTRDRAGMDRSDVDKKKMSSNGSSSHYRRNTGSASGLGGYSPRKRKSDTATKTPSPTRRSPERKVFGWDLPPVGKDSISTSSTVNNLTTLNQNKSVEMKEFPLGTPLIQPVVNPVGISHLTLPSKIHAIESVQLTQATRPMRRLYAENLPSSASEKDLMECINKFLLSSGVNYIQGTQPCISCMIHKEKGQALLEFLTPEDASAAIAFDGISFSGSNLKLRRPRDYTDVTTGPYEKSVIAVDPVSNIVEDSPHKIFIGGISRVISSQMLLEIARGFGSVKAYHFKLAADSNDQSAYLEYVDHSVSSKACVGLNGMKLGGQIITAVFATPNAVQENVGEPPFYGIPDHAKSLLANPTTVLTLRNVLDPVGLLALSESELEEILEDIRLECSRFGTVKAINVVKPNDSAQTTEAHETKDINVVKPNDSAHTAEAHETKDINVVKPNDSAHTAEAHETKDINVVKPNDSAHTAEAHETKDINVVKPNDTAHTAEAHETKDMDASTYAVDLDDKSHVTKQLDDSINELREDDRLDTSEAPTQSENNEVAEAIKVDDNTNSLGISMVLSGAGLIGDDVCDNLKKDEMIKKPSDENSTPEDPPSHQNSDNLAGESAIQPSALTNELESNVNGAESNPVRDIEMVNKPLTEPEVKAGETDAEIVNAAESDFIESIGASEETDKKDNLAGFGDVFEPGAVFVEYRRAEAACMAAHCLQGRIFDGRCVTVGYVAHDLYQMKFRR